MCNVRPMMIVSYLDIFNNKTLCNIEERIIIRVYLHYPIHAHWNFFNMENESFEYIFRI